MKNRSLPIVLSIVMLFWFFYGCAAARPADMQDSAAAPVPAAQPALGAQIPPPSTQDESPSENDLLLDDEFGWEEDTTEIYTVPDPLEPFNRAMFVFNDRLYFWLMKPVARGYRAAVPRPARSAAKNFFVNLAAPIRIVNNILQGNGQGAEAEWARFLFNSTVGVLGFRDPAAAYPELAYRPEDLGQTLGVYGIGNGFYIYWPVLGPSTLRDSVGMLGDRFLNPVGYVDPLELSLGISSYNMINNISFRIGDYEALKKAALDPYQAFRNAYIQLRQAEIRRDR